MGNCTKEESCLLCTLGVGLTRVNDDMIVNNRWYLLYLCQVFINSYYFKGKITILFSGEQKKTYSRSLGLALEAPGWAQAQDRSQIQHFSQDQVMRAGHWLYWVYQPSPSLIIWGIEQGPPRSSLTWVSEGTYAGEHGTAVSHELSPILMDEGDITKECSFFTVYYLSGKPHLLVIWNTGFDFKYGNFKFPNSYILSRMSQGNQMILVGQYGCCLDVHAWFKTNEQDRGDGASL